MPIVDELADSNTIDFYILCMFVWMFVCMCVRMYVCMYVLPKQIFDAPTSAPQFNASYKAGRREPQLGPLETLSRSGGDDLPFGFQRFIQSWPA